MTYSIDWQERDDMFSSGFHWCTKCLSFLPIDNFQRNKGTRYGFHSWCRNCHNNSRKSDDIIRRRARRYNRKIKSHYKNIIGGKCAKCGYERSQFALDFHHVDPGTKDYGVCKLINTNNEELIISEIDKCVLFCRNCHAEYESGCFTCDFIKADVGYIIDLESIVEKNNGWSS